MAAFRFRAAAALELRHRQETAAATVLSRAEGALHAAESRLTESQQQRRLAQDHAATAERQGTDGQTVLWHRNWIVRLSDAVEQSRRELDASVATVREAEQNWREARKRRLALERMRERAWRRYQQAEQRQEMKVIDELARLRFIAHETVRDDP